MLLCTTVLSKLVIDYSLMGEDRKRPLIEALSDFMPLLKALWGLKEGISRALFAKARLLFKKEGRGAAIPRLSVLAKFAMSSGPNILDGETANGEGAIVEGVRDQLTL